MKKLRTSPTAHRCRYRHNNLPTQDLLFKQFMQFCEDEGQQRVRKIQDEADSLKLECKQLLAELSDSKIYERPDSWGEYYSMRLPDDMMKVIFRHRDIDTLREIITDSIVLDISKKADRYSMEKFHRIASIRS